MSKKQPPYAPEYRRQMVCASPWFERAARPRSWLASSSAPRRRSATGCARRIATRDCREDGLTSSELEELRRVREERDILAKATAWFARETGSVPGRSSGS